MLAEIKDGSLLILEYSWPMIVLSIIIAMCFRITYLVHKKEKFILHEELFKLALIIYILCLFHAVTYQDVSWSTANFIPFKEIFRYDLGSRLFIKNILGNMIMFIPMGIFIKKFLDLDNKKIVVLLLFIISMTIEVTQLIIGRVYDIDDVLLNIIGGFIGFALADSFSKIKLFKNNVVLNIISLLLLGGVIWFLFL